MFLFARVSPCFFHWCPGPIESSIWYNTTNRATICWGQTLEAQHLASRRPMQGHWSLLAVLFQLTMWHSYYFQQHDNACFSEDFGEKTITDFSMRMLYPFPSTHAFSEIPNVVSLRAYLCTLTEILEAMGMLSHCEIFVEANRFPVTCIPHTHKLVCIDVSKRCVSKGWPPQQPFTFELGIVRESEQEGATQSRSGHKAKSIGKI